MSFCAAKGSAKWRRIERSGRFCVNMLRRDQAALSAQLASRIGDRFAGVNWTQSPGGAPIIGKAVGWLDCVVYDQIDAGDHVLTLGQVRAFDVISGATPLVFLRGHYGVAVTT